jgi:hypothetical protein
MFVHSFLEVSVYMQYGKEIELSFDSSALKSILTNIFSLFPPFLFIIYYSHKHANALWMQGLLVIAITVLGNMFPIGKGLSFSDYERAPAIGALLAYAFIQIRLELAIISIGIMLLSYSAKYWRV